MSPTADCDETKTLEPTVGRRCGARLSGSDAVPLPHQVGELAEIRSHVTDYQRHRLTCPWCGETTCAALPMGVSTGHTSVTEAAEARMAGRKAPSLLLAL